MDGLVTGFTDSLSSGSLYGNLFHLVFTSGPVARTVLAVLAFFSTVSWAIIAERWLVIRRAKKETPRFLQDFHEDGTLTELSRRSQLYKSSPLARIYRSGYAEFRRLLEQMGSAPPSRADWLLQITGRRLKSALDRAVALEARRLERFLFFLATTASAAPFIGLFGTVWGIMNAFQGIGVRGSASIAAVAPGISEALITTAAGLVAAVPAVIGYNFFLARINEMTGQMDQFASEILVPFEMHLASRASVSEGGPRGPVTGVPSLTTEDDN